MEMFSKCRLKIYRARLGRDHSLLAFYCARQDHDHEHHPVMRTLTENTVVVDAEELYREMTNPG